MLELDFKGFCELENLRIISDGFTVLDTKFDFRLHHLWPRDENGKVDPGKLESFYPEARKKVDFLISCWRQSLLNTQKRLFIWTLDEDMRSGMSAKESVLCFQALLPTRCNYELVIVQDIKFYEPDWFIPRVIQRYIGPGPKGMEWRGDSERWQALFKEFEFAPDVSWKPVIASGTVE